MPYPIPDPGATNLQVPDAAEVERISRGIAAAVALDGGLSATQRLMLQALVPAMTGYPATLDGAPLGPEGLAEALASRNLAFRERILQLMILLALVLRPLPQVVAERVAEYAGELSVDDGLLPVARRFAEGTLGLAAIDFERNGYGSMWTPEMARSIHASRQLDTPWDFVVADEELARRWESLERLPEGTLGRRVTEFYRARGFTYPGRPGSAPPLLAQHDWVHVVADYGSTVESELEVFGFIARANDDPRAFSLLAMVVCLFESGYLQAGAGLFQSSTGHLSEAGMAARVADAMRRGALCRGSIDFMAIDWFELADATVEEAGRHFGVPPKATSAVEAGSVGPWEPGGISPYQLNAGQELASRTGRPYDSFGASPSIPPSMAGPPGSTGSG